MPRSYGDACGIARALDAVGERWAMLIVRELLLGPKRFTDLEAGLRGISPDVLASRLRDLEATGIAARRTLPAPAASKVYELTDRGRALEPALKALGRWGSTQPRPAGPPALGADATVIALPTLFASDGGDPLTVELRLPEPFTVRIDGALDVQRGEARDPDAVVETTPGELAAVLWHGAPARGLTVQGSRRAVNRFVRLFPLPAG